MTAATLQLEPLDATFGAIVRGVELRSLDDATYQALYDAWIEHALLIFPGQFLTKDEQKDFALRFGELEFATVPISNVDKDGNVHSEPGDDTVKSLRGNEGWHHDSTYMPVQAKGAVFSAEIVPADGAATGWADMRAAYEALDDETRGPSTGLSAYHSLYYSQGRVGYLPSKNDEGRLQRLRLPRRRSAAAAAREGPPGHRPSQPLHRPPRLRHRGHGPRRVRAVPRPPQRRGLPTAPHLPPPVEVGDAVIWDNRRLMHRATPFDMTQPRRMWHTRIAGERPSELATNYR